MSLLVLLCLAVLLLTAFEVFLTGGILGVGAVFCLLAATYVCFSDYGFLPAVLLFFGTASASLVLAIIQFRWWIKSPVGRGLFLREVVGGDAPVKEKDDMIGFTGEALTRLNPSGKVVINGSPYEAYSEDGYIEAHESVRVVGRDAFKLIIQKT
ncbi:MAG: hypothetical protein CBC33_002510 [Coraliomargarita sp. TMED73]|nr:MAG: hypothetical protein CBC33_002510 [Coraliomargarita sp. TMED73]